MYCFNYVIFQKFISKLFLFTVFSIYIIGRNIVLVKQMSKVFKELTLIQY